MMDAVHSREEVLKAADDALAQVIIINIYHILS